MAADEAVTRDGARPSRRRILTAAAGAAGALAVQAMGRAQAAEAGTDGDVVLGGTNTTGGTTEIDSSGGIGLFGVTTGTNTNPGVWGRGSASADGVSGDTFSSTKAGVHGGNTHGGPGVLGDSATSAPGVKGHSQSGDGVYGDTGGKAGVHGFNNTNGNPFSGGEHAGVFGECTGSTAAGVIGSAVKPGSVGVRGTSNSGRGVVGSTDSGPAGVHGVYSNTGVPASSGAGVVGESLVTGTPGISIAGVMGTSVSGDGVLGKDSLVGVHGVSSGGGTGVFGEATAFGTGLLGSAPAAGFGLRTFGRVKFSTAGLATISSGSKSVKVTPGIPLDSSSKVFCTLQSQGGSLKNVIVQAKADTFVINLQSAATRDVEAAWFVIS